MEFETLTCERCSTVSNIPKKAFEVFKKSTVVCVECRAPINSSGVATKAIHPSDPRPDLKTDAELWTALLFRLWDISQEVYYTFHGLRIAGSHLSSKDAKIEFRFAEEYTPEMIANIRVKYLAPHKDLIQGVMSRLAKDTANHDSLRDCPY